MQQPIKKYQFRCIGGVYVDVLGDSKTTLAQTLMHLNLQIDDTCEFARFRNYDTKQYIFYRASARIVTIEIWKIPEDYGH